MKSRHTPYEDSETVYNHDAVAEQVAEQIVTASDTEKPGIEERLDRVEAILAAHQLDVQ